MLLKRREGCFKGTKVSNAMQKGGVIPAMKESLACWHVGAFARNRMGLGQDRVITLHASATTDENKESPERSTLE